VAHKEMKEHFIFDTLLNDKKVMILVFCIFKPRAGDILKKANVLKH
jgi:hypothetical protein